jgi:hypothetical protein
MLFPERPLNLFSYFASQSVEPAGGGCFMHAKLPANIFEGDALQVMEAE